MRIPLQLDGLEGLTTLTFSVICIALLLGFIVWVYVCIWVYRDAEKRGSSGMLWALLVFFFGIIPLIIWLVARPPLNQYQYGGMGYMPPPPTYAHCPSCGQPLTLVPQYNRWYCNNCRKYP